VEENQMGVVRSHVASILAKRTAWAGAAALLALLAGPAQAATPTPTAVVVDPSFAAYTPTATATDVAWEQNSAANPGSWNVRARSRSGGASWQVNSVGSAGYNPSAVVGGTDTIIYQQAGSRDSNLLFYNLVTKTRKKAPAKVDSPLWEYYPEASTKYIAFMRLNSTSRLLLLYNRSHDSITKIASVKKSCNFCLQPTFVGASHLVYTQCSASTFACTIRVLTIGGSSINVPRQPAPHSTWGATYDESTGDVYYVNSTTWCGLFASVDRWNVSGASSPEVIVDFTEGIDGGSTALAPDQAVPGDTDLLYSQYDCISGDSDIWQLASVNTFAGTNPGALGQLSPSAGRRALPPRPGGSPPAG
jgi:hypothetical protein